jgi:hypothetical protein
MPPRRRPKFDLTEPPHDPPALKYGHGIQHHLRPRPVEVMRADATQLDSW